MPNVTCRFCETEMEVKKLRRHWLNDCLNLPEIKPDERLCSDCQSPKKTTEDFSIRRESPDGLQNACKDCNIVRIKQWRIDNGGGSQKLPDMGFGEKLLRPGRWKLKPCKYCDKEFNWTGMHVHLRSCEKHPRNRSRRPANPDLPDMTEILTRYNSQTVSERAKSATLRQTYGIDIHDYNRMLDEQNGVCAICRLPPAGKRNSRNIHLAVDHDHVSGAVRRLLCQHCNVGLGGFKDSVGLLKAAIAYIESFNAVPESHEKPS